MELKEKEKTLRRIRGWTQKDLAREIGVNVSTVQRWEKREGRPTTAAHRELEKVFRTAHIGP